MWKIVLTNFLMLFTLAASGQEPTAQAQPQQRRLAVASRPFFVPHWYVKAQAGAAYDIGEAKFSQLLSPSLQLSLGYRFSELFGVRGSLSGLWARNRYAYPEEKYQWNFIQPAVDFNINLTSLILGSDPERLTNVYAFIGGGVAYSFNNDDAVEADKRYGVDFQKLWHDQRWNPVVRAGIGVDYEVTDGISLNAEFNGNMLPDHFNSKYGKHDNRDWHLNALVGVKFTIGKTHGRTEPEYEVIQPAPVIKDVPIDKISFNVNIYFVINQSIIRQREMYKLDDLISYLNKHPNAFIRLSGYADKETGNPTINMRLSRERAQAVSQYLQARGIHEARIRRFAHGDRVQPFSVPEDNRVCTCYVYNPDEL